ncbi:MAG: hypothetical protein U0790_20480 [Isosphaeraceae bacterium]
MHSKAVTMGRIADVLQARGEQEEALRIWRDEVLPAFQKLRNPQLIAQAQIRLGFLSFESGQSEEGAKMLVEALQNARRADDRATVAYLEKLFGIGDESAG